MRAIVFDHFGDESTLRIGEADPPPLAGDELRIRARPQSAEGEESDDRGVIPGQLRRRSSRGTDPSGHRSRLSLAEAGEAHRAMTRDHFGKIG
jgi:NADPH:quinone reductase-like Zn-dependent oxidoreductase